MLIDNASYYKIVSSIDYPKTSYTVKMPINDINIQKKLCIEYIRTRDYKQAALLAGFDSEQTESQTKAMLNRPENLIYCARIEAAIALPQALEPDEIKQILSNLAKGNAVDEVLDREGNIKRLSINARDRIAAAKVLGEFSGLSKQTIDINSTDLVQFVFNRPDSDSEVVQVDETKTEEK